MSLVPLGPGREFDAIRMMLARWGSAAAGIGGDAADLAVPPGQRLLVSTDTSVEGVHFRREWMTPAEIGYRATVAALSDLAAVAATPLALLLAVTVPSSWVDALPAVADGVGEAARGAGAPIVGGDTVRGDALALTVTVLGVATHPWSRIGAEPGGRVFVTGVFGGPLAALRALDASVPVVATARHRLVHPTPRLGESRWLADQPVAAAIDVSDGLVADVAHLAAASGVRIALDLDRVPRFDGVTALDAGASGEEYELALIARPGATLDTAAFAARFALPLTEIGVVTAAHPSGGVDVMLAGRRVDPPRGYDHFSR